MSRKPYQIQLSTTLSNGYDQAIQIVDAVWHLTYNGKLAKIRTDTRQAGTGFKYLKSCWATEASGWLAVEKLRQRYKDDGFALLEITP